MVGHVAGLALDFLARRRPSLRCWNFGTLRPGSFRELLALCNQYNWRHVKVVGYNNGVNHFGQRYPGKTIVSTINCNRALLKKRTGAAAGLPLSQADCGTTIRKARELLARSGLQLPVIPNYSYVCLGTAFFVPIHGSASDFSTVADTITRVLLYDPMLDRFITATQRRAGISGIMSTTCGPISCYCGSISWSSQSRSYYVRKEVLKNASGAELLNALRDSVPRTWRSASRPRPATRSLIQVLPGSWRRRALRSNSRGIRLADCGTDSKRTPSPPS